MKTKIAKEETQKLNKTNKNVHSYYNKKAMEESNILTPKKMYDIIMNKILLAEKATEYKINNNLDSDTTLITILEKDKEVLDLYVTVANERLKYSDQLSKFYQNTNIVNIIKMIETNEINCNYNLHGSTIDNAFNEGKRELISRTISLLYELYYNFMNDYTYRLKTFKQYNNLLELLAVQQQISDIFDDESYLEELEKLINAMGDFIPLNKKRYIKAIKRYN